MTGKYLRRSPQRRVGVDLDFRGVLTRSRGLGGVVSPSLNSGVANGT